MLILEKKYQFSSILFQE